CILDNVCRPNVERNLVWLQRTHGDRSRIEAGDIRNRQTVTDVLTGIDHVFHLAAQVAVTTSIKDPLVDFSTNVIGTLNLLEEIRKSSSPPSILYTSTNKVYGSLGELPLRRDVTRWV